MGGEQVQGPGFRRSMCFCETHRQPAGHSQQRDCSESPIHSSVKYRWLVCSGCYTKRSQSGWLKTMEIDSSQSGGWKSKAKVQPAQFLVQKTVFWLCPPSSEEQRKTLPCPASSYKNISLIVRAPPLGPSHLPKAPPPDTITLGITV